MQTCIFDAPLAVKEGERGMAVADASPIDWAGTATTWFDELWPGHTLTADDLTAICDLPTNVDGTPTNNCVGAFLNRLRRQGRLELVRYERSTRVSSKGRVLARWRKVA
jgi:hypothetical protein